MPQNRIRMRPPICIGSEPRLLDVPDGETLDVAPKFGAIEKSGIPAKLPPIHLSLSCGCYCVIDIALSSLSN
jgi:hypothetical protein